MNDRDQTKIQESQRTHIYPPPPKYHPFPQIYTSRHIIMKLLKTKDKVLKITREKGTLHTEEQRITVNFLSETMQAR